MDDNLITLKEKLKKEFAKRQNEKTFYNTENIKNPDHYKGKKFEVQDYLKDFYPLIDFIAHKEMTIIEYAMRLRKKDTAKSNAIKIIKNAEMIIEALEQENEPTE